MLSPSQIRKVLKELGLPPLLVELIRSGRLVQEVERVQRQIDELNTMLDAWEAANPEAAAVAPWRDARDAWNAAGRPRSPWWELLRAVQVSPMSVRELDGTVVKEWEHQRYARYKVDPEAWERYRSHRRAADLRYQLRRKEAKRQAEKTAMQLDARFDNPRAAFWGSRS